MPAGVLLALLPFLGAQESPAAGVGYARAIARHEAGDLEAAARANAEVVAKEPRHVAAWANLGVALAALGRYGEAIDAYGEALKLRPGDPGIRLNLALPTTNRPTSSGPSTSSRGSTTSGPATRARRCNECLRAGSPPARGLREDEGRQPDRSAGCRDLRGGSRDFAGAAKLPRHSVWGETETDRAWVIRSARSITHCEGVRRA